MSIIQLKSVSRTYVMGKETIPALDDVSLDIKEGEFLAIMGPSGSGKSTFANVIGGLDKPSSGDVLVDGECINKLNDKHISSYRNRKVGFIFQSFNLLPTYTALENVMIPLILTGESSSIRKQKAYECLKEVGLENRADHKPYQLSGGERQRVSIARALINEPQIIIADEPTGNLDTKKSEEIVCLLKDLNRKKKITVIVITHDPSIARQADRTLHMRDGKIGRAQ
jgi:putative ABC transport system ATP-binding protein